MNSSDVKTILVALSSFLGMVAARAEPPVASYVFPAGGQRGNAVSLRVGGLFFHGEARFHVTDTGLTASPLIREIPRIWFEGPMIHQPASQRGEDYPRDHGGSLEITPDAIPGVKRWFVSTSQGVTRSLPFVVGDLPEIVEQEEEGDLPATPVNLPVTINGRIFPREDRDVWQITAAAGEWIHGDIAARRIEMPLQATVSVSRPDGSKVACQTVQIGGDPTFTFQASEAGKYLLEIGDANFGGSQSHIYRLTLERGPRVPRDWGSTWKEGALLPFPGVAKGCLSQPGMQSWHLPLKKDQRVLLEVFAARIESRLDARLEIQSANGQKLTENDDPAEGITDSRILFTAPRDEDFRILVGDRFPTRSGPDFGYELRTTEVTEPVEFRLSLDTDAVTVVRDLPPGVGPPPEMAPDGKPKKKTRTRGTGIPVKLELFGTLKVDVLLSVEGLPPGVTADESTLKLSANRRATEVFFDAAQDAPLTLGGVKLTGTVEIDGRKLARTALQEKTGEDSVRFAVAPAVPFRFESDYWVETGYPVGSQLSKTYRLERSGFSGPLRVELSDRQIRHLQGVTAEPLMVPAGADSFTYTVTLPPRMEMGRTSRVQLMLSGETIEPDGGRHLVSYTNSAPEQQMMSIVSEGRLRLTPGATSLAVRPGGSVILPVTVQRADALADLPVQVELLVPSPMHRISAPPVILPPGSTKAELEVSFGEKPGPAVLPLKVRASTQTGESQKRHVAEAEVELVPAIGKVMAGTVH